MTTILDGTAAAVDTFADLQSILQGSNTYTTVYLAADITMTAGIAISAGKAEMVIDGRYPLDGTGTVHTLTDCNSTDENDTLGIRSAGEIAMTVRNLHIVGRNDNGILYVPDGAAYSNVTTTYEAVTYTGPRMTRNAYGRTRYIDCDIIIRDGDRACREAGEVNNLEIGGKTTITQASSDAPLLRYRGSAPTLTVLAGAEVKVTAGNDGIVTDHPIALTVQPDAGLTMYLQKSVGRDSSDRFSSILVDTGAALHVEQSANSGYHTIYCDGSFTVNEGADVYLQAIYAGTPHVLQYYSENGSLVLNNPRSFVLYRGVNQAYCLNCRYDTDVVMEVGQLNEWITNADTSIAGGLDDAPFYCWRKADDSALQMTLTCRASAVMVSHNLTAEELAALPPLSYFLPLIVRVLSMGNLPLERLAVTDDGHPVTGKTAGGANVRISFVVDGTDYTVDGKADAEGNFSIDTPITLPLGTEVACTVNTPFLYSHGSAVAEDGGVLRLESAPATLPFRLEPICTSPVLFGRESPEWALTLVDSRVHIAPWYLYATAPHPMTGDDPAHTVPGSLVFVDERGEIRPLGAQPVLVASGEGAEDGQPITVTWAAARGPLMRPGSAPFYNGERYTAAITWTLTDTPLGE